MQRTFAVGSDVIQTEALARRAEAAWAVPPVAIAVPGTGTPEARFGRATDNVVRRCRVPKIKAGATLKSAKAALVKAGCKAPRKPRAVRSSKVRKGRVIGLTRKAGKELPAGTAVQIKVSSGRKRR